MIADLINNIKAKLGSTHRNLELSDEQLVDILQKETLVTLSIYLPFYVEYMLDFKSNRIEGQHNMYNVPEVIGGQFRVIGVEKVIPSYLAQTGLSTGWFGVLGSDMRAAMSNFMSAKTAASAISSMMVPETFQFLPPNMLRLYSSLCQDSAFIVLKTTHRLDFATIPFGYREIVMKLAMADVAGDLLGIRNYFSQIGTTFGEINLNTELLSSWVEKRDDVIEQLRNNQLKNAGAKKIWVV